MAMRSAASYFCAACSTSDSMTGTSEVTSTADVPRRRADTPASGHLRTHAEPHLQGHSIAMRPGYEVVCLHAGICGNALIVPRWGLSA
jgi:hypothetical protein